MGKGRSILFSEKDTQDPLKNIHNTSFIMCANGVGLNFDPGNPSIALLPALFT